MIYSTIHKNFDDVDETIMSEKELHINSVKKFYIETYGCQMNFSDSEVVASILQNDGWQNVSSEFDADLILINTCSIRDKAEQTVRKRLTELNKLKLKNRSMLLGIIGCMAERLKTQLLEEEKLIDIVMGPDSYRSLPDLIAEAESGQRAINVLLSREETYADISPVRINSNGISGFVSIMRGCNNMCSFCVVPFTRGRERSRNPNSIVKECEQLFEMGYREVTLLGQNVDSYCYEDGEHLTNFADLLVKVAEISPLLRVRFSTSHPKDITDDVLYAIANHKNICKYIHLPVQSGSNRMLELMNRKYTNEWYKNIIDKIYNIIPECAVSSDIIAGFCGETNEDHQQTLEIMRYSKYAMSYMFAYSERSGTPAQKNLKDDISIEIKKQRLNEIIELQNQLSLQSNQNDIGIEFEVLIEGDSKRSSEFWMGRNSQNKVVVFPKLNNNLNRGDYVNVKIESCTQATLFGEMKN